jgi:hypothetical protein
LAKPNYSFQKAERERAKHRKKQEKLKRLEEESTRRQTERVDETDPDAPASSDAGDP